MWKCNCTECKKLASLVSFMQLFAATEALHEDSYNAFVCVSD